MRILNFVLGMAGLLSGIISYVFSISYGAGFFYLLGGLSACALTGLFLMILAIPVAGVIDWIQGK